MLSALTIPPATSEIVTLSDHFSDPDEDDTLTYSARSSDTTVATVDVSGATLTIEGHRPGTATITVTATDPSEESVSDWFIVTVPDPDTQPSFGGQTVPDQSYMVGETIAPLVLPAARGGDGRLTYSLTPTVPGLRFAAATRTLQGTPSATGTHSMTYRVVDGDGDDATLRFVIVVNPADTQPSFRGQTVPDQSYMVGETIAPLVLPAARGGDGRLTYTLRPSVPGLNFDPDTRTLTGTPSDADSHAMTYTVTDEDDDTDVLTFTVMVKPETVPDGSTRVYDRSARFRAG